jgi:serine/threonine protein kinase
MLPRDARFCPYDGSELGRDSSEHLGRNSGLRDVVDGRRSLVGSIIDERYEVLQLLGEGGMGCVYRVRHRVLGRLFALKALRPEYARDHALAERFVQEARAAASIAHPNVVGITDFGVFGDGQPYFVMELLEGRTLGSVLRERSTIEPEEVARMARAMACALAAAHAVGVIHRDLKPDNVMLLGDGTVTAGLKVLDFGLAVLLGASRLSSEDVVYGTPQYMSPEQARGDPIDARIDVYALGILMYEMLTGRVPFEADSQTDVLSKHLHEDAMPPSRMCPAVSRCEGLESIVLGCLHKDPNARFAGMREVVEALDKILLMIPTPAALDSARMRSSSSIRPPCESRAHWRRINRRRWWGVTGIGLAALWVSLALLFGRLHGGTNFVRSDAPDVPKRVEPIAQNPIQMSASERNVGSQGEWSMRGATVRHQARMAPGKKKPESAPNRPEERSVGRLVDQLQQYPGVGRMGVSAGGSTNGFVEQNKTGSSEMANPWAK